MKKLFALLMSLFLILTLSACNNDDNPQDDSTKITADKFYGTWDSHSAKIDGSIFTIEELETMGDYSLSDFRIIIKEGGKAYAYAEGEGELIDWELTDTGIKIGIRDCILQDNLLSITNNDVTIFLSKTSSSQTIQNPETPNSSHTHSGGMATCNTKAVCSTCKQSYGSYNADNHASSRFVYTVNSSDATKHDKKYSCCGYVVSTSEHSGGTATTTERAKCEYCDVEYGNLLAKNCSEGLEYALVDGGYAVSGIGTCTDTEIVIPKEYIGKSVISIGYRAFSGCSALTSITIPDSVTSIGDEAFWCCSGITSITIPDSVISIGENAFGFCYAIENITIPAMAISHIPNRSLITVVITSGNSISDYAFSECSNLARITISDSVTSIGMDAFSFCPSLTSISIPSSIASIGVRAFYGCKNLMNITLENGIKSIGNYAFYSCKSLKSITIPDSVTSIGRAAFEGCTSLTDINIPNSVTSISEHTFHDCTSLVSITIPDSVTSIGSYAFYGCSSLSSITIPYNVVLVNNSTFYKCDNLKSIIIPDSVTSIVSYAFFDCSSLTDIYYTGSEEKWNEIRIGSYNSYLSNATIHYNYVPEE